jgi:ubiquinone/menaquinone biosynthesis C-methylase UbiE
MEKYVHGYSEREKSRLEDQANTLDALIHHDTLWGKGETILEAGCGVGAQTQIIAPKNPESHFVSVDISVDSVVKAKQAIEMAAITNVQFKVADIFNLPFEDETFDHVFVCFVLEHLSEPIRALAELKRVLKKGGSMTAIEGDHGSAYFYPDSAEARKAIECQVQLQKNHGGNALIGRELYPLLTKAGFKNVKVSPRMVYVDNSRPELVEGFTRNTFTAMIEGVRESAIQAGLAPQSIFDKGVVDLYRTAEEDGVFCYTFFKAKAIK